MTPEQRKAIEILNKIRDFMRENLSEDDYMYLMGIIIEQKGEITYIPYRDPFTWPQVTYGIDAKQTGRG